MKKLLTVLLFLLSTQLSDAQRKGYWQQHVDYRMEIDMDEQNFQYDGTMELRYANNSGQSLSTIYFHLYFNAFQPGSMMDHRLANISDPDKRMMHEIDGPDGPTLVSRISTLKESEIGYQKIHNVVVDGEKSTFQISGTILEVQLAKPIADGHTATIEMSWSAQVPEQIRRSGRNSKEGVALSMTQWYPKMAHFDEFGWHLDEYVAREFVAPFGDFDISIHIDKDYIIGASGVLQNPNAVKGYSTEARVTANEDGKATWHFKAENIHDFAWAADPKFVVDSAKTDNNTTLYTLHIPSNKTTTENWRKALAYTVDFFNYCDLHFGQYPWPSYTIAQGGDGGMEYGTATLVTGERSLRSLVNVIFHEVAHSWYQQMFGINETVDDWFDEGFASLIEDIGMQLIYDKQGKLEPNPVQSAYTAYTKLALSGKEEPASLLADYYNTNYAYSNEAYNKGQVLAVQLGYIIGEENLRKTFLKFYEIWKFKHPTPNDFKRIAEDISGINLKWYFNLFVNTTRQVDYAVIKETEQTFVLKNQSDFAMPIDLFVEYQDGSKELFYIPLREMRGKKEAEDLELYKDVKFTVLEDWFWTNPDYVITLSKDVKKIAIDPSLRLADVNREDNVWESE